MKVLHIIDSLVIGGAETLVAELCVAAHRAGTGVELFVLQGGGPLEPDVRKAGIPVHSGGSGSVYSPLHVLRLARLLKQRQFDIIHVHLFPAQLWVCIASRLARNTTPVVTTEHSTSNRRRTALFRLPDRWMYGQFASIAAISQATLDALLAHVGSEMPMTRVVLNGVDSARFAAHRPRLAETSEPLVVLTTGSLTKVKDQATLIRAVARIDGVKLVIAGDGPLRPELERLSSQPGVSSRVEFLGARRDIPELIAAADIYVQASIWEGFCLAVVEAMCGGLPCIAARNSGLQEVVGQAGIYFEPGNVDELVQAIRLVAADSALRATLSSRSIDQAARYTLKACIDSYDRFYRDTLQLASAQVRTA